MHALPYWQRITASDMTLFPLMLKLSGRKCIVVGAGKVAASKIKGLLACGARLTVVSPEAGKRIHAYARAGQLVWRRKSFSPRDLGGAFLVIAATDSPAVNAAVFHSCQTRKILCNSVDDPAHCDFFYPAVVRRGPLQIAISTGGCSPALAARLRKDLSREFGPEWSVFVEHLADLRQQILRTALSSQRERLLNKIATQKAFRAFVRARASRTRTRSL